MSSSSVSFCFIFKLSGVAAVEGLNLGSVLY